MSEIVPPPVPESRGSWRREMRRAQDVADKRPAARADGRPTHNEAREDQAAADRRAMSGKSAMPGGRMPGKNGQPGRQRQLASANAQLVGGAVTAAKTITDPNTSAKEKAVAGATAAATAVATAAGSPLAGKVVGTAMKSKSGRRVLLILAAVVVLMLTFVATTVASVVQAASMIVVTDPDIETASYGDSCTAGHASGTDPTLNPAQTALMAEVIDAVTARGLNADDVAITVMTVLTENTAVDNTPGGDRDSVGLFQQRASWGSVEDRMNPTIAAGKFLDRLTAPGLKLFGTKTKINMPDASNRATFAPWMVAQSVQASGFSDGSNYQSKYVRAVQITTSLTGDAPPSAQKWADAAGLTLSPAAAPTDTNTAAPTGIGSSTSANLVTVLDGSGCAVTIDSALLAAAQLALAPETPVIVQVDGLIYAAALTGAVQVSVGGTGEVLPLEDIGGPDVLTSGLATGGGGTPNATSPGAWGGFSNGLIPLSAMTAIPWNPNQYLEARAAAALIAMNASYRAKFGVDISITDGYRTLASQVSLKASKGALAATPGKSNHGWAKALDLGGGINSWGTPQRNWMVANAPGYGWVSPAWAQPGNKGGHPLEAWHWEFNGVAGR